MPIVLARRFNRAFLVGLAAAVVAASCGAPRATLGLDVTPKPLPVSLVMPCGGVFAGLPCSASDYVQAKWTAAVSSTNEIGGRGVIEVLVVDAATGLPIPEPQGTVTGGGEFVLAPRATAAVPLEWKRTVPTSGPGRIPPPQFAFIVTVRLTDTMGRGASESLTVREALPRNWQIF